MLHCISLEIKVQEEGRRRMNWKLRKQCILTSKAECDYVCVSIQNLSFTLICLIGNRKYKELIPDFAENMMFCIYCYLHIIVFACSCFPVSV